jgi:hypothetical protein
LGFVTLWLWPKRVPYGKGKEKNQKRLQSLRFENTGFKWDKLRSGHFFRYQKYLLHVIYIGVLTTDSRTQVYLATDRDFCFLGVVKLWYKEWT